jgi:membrane fusion protein, multidrug efflux system
VYAVAEKKNESGALEKDANGQPLLIAERRFVETGERRGGLVLVSKGLSAGEQVVSAGQLKLDNGTPIAISPDKNLPAGH